MRDSHGLFDYESRSITKKNLKTQSQGKIFRLNNDIEFLPLSKKEKELAGVTPSDVVKPILQLKSDKGII